jgi:hypothetical protein
MKFPDVYGPGQNPDQFANDLQQASKSWGKGALDRNSNGQSTFNSFENRASLVQNKPM